MIKDLLITILSFIFYIIMIIRLTIIADIITSKILVQFVYKYHDSINVIGFIILLSIVLMSNCL